MNIIRNINKFFSSNNEEKELLVKDILDLLDKYDNKEDNLVFKKEELMRNSISDLKKLKEFLTI